MCGRPEKPVGTPLVADRSGWNGAICHVGGRHPPPLLLKCMPRHVPVPMPGGYRFSHGFALNEKSLETVLCRHTVWGSVSLPQRNASVVLVRTRRTHRSVAVHDIEGWEWRASVQPPETTAQGEFAHTVGTVRSQRPLFGDILPDTASKPPTTQNPAMQRPTAVCTPRAQPPPPPPKKSLTTPDPCGGVATRVPLQRTDCS